LFKKIIALVFKKFFLLRGIITPLKNILKEHDPWFSYLPFVIDVKDFSKEYFKNDRVNILEVGKFVERKGHLDILMAINSLKVEYNLKLTIVGERVDEQVKNNILEYIQKNSLEEIVEIKENLSHQEVLSLYREQDLFVLPSYDEPAAYSLVEAMAAKLPVIASDTCGTSCYIEQSKNGYIFKSRDSQNLAEKIELIIKNRDNLVKMGGKSFDLAKTNHSLPVFIDEFKKICLKK
jgi:glycosyltransferase involved in cell wall biosynthesis